MTVSYRSGQFFWPNFDSSTPLYSKLHDVSTPDLKPALISSVDIKNPIRGRIIDVYISYESSDKTVDGDVVLQYWPTVV